VNGPALAGGFDLAVLCDVRVASTTAVFAHPEVTFGDVVYGPLHDLVGGAVARELVLTGRSLDAEEALALHLVSAVAAPDDFAAEVRCWTEQLTRAPRELLLRTKQKIIRRAGEHPCATLTSEERAAPFRTWRGGVSGARRSFRCGPGLRQEPRPDARERRARTVRYDIEGAESHRVGKTGEPARWASRWLRRRSRQRSGQAI
jgi:hypothetical protein